MFIFGQKRIQKLRKTTKYLHLRVYFADATLHAAGGFEFPSHKNHDK